MKKLHQIFPFILVSLLLFSFRSHARIYQNKSTWINTDSIAGDTLIRFDSNSGDGYHFPFYVFIPKGTKTGKQFLLVEPNNNGVNDSLQYHEREAKKAAQRQSLGNSISRRLKVPYLVPAFPRPQKEWKIYTHALDRDAALIEDGDMKRLDLQLIAMIKKAKVRLKELNFELNEKILLNGFSASATFVNRFTMIHPELIAGVAGGGLNAILILPLKEIKGDKLNYPLGINDVELIFGRPLNLDAVKKIPQFIYMGENDTNDAALFDDGYSKKEREAIFKHMGKIMLPDRWNKCKSYYENAGMNAEFKIYQGIGHGTDGKMNREIAAFFKKVMNEQQ